MDDENSSSSSSASLHTIPDIDDFDINNYEDPSTITQLMQAVRSGNIEAVSDALKLNRDGLVNIPNNQGFTALHFAVLGKDLDIVRLLLQVEEINVNAKDWTGKTPLMHACQNRVPVELIRCLLEYDCDVALKDNTDMTALCYALLGVDHDFTGFNGTVVELLTDYGAEIDQAGLYNIHPISLVLVSHKVPLATKEEIVGTLLYCGVDPSVSLQNITTITDPTLYDMILPYFTTCHIENLTNYDIGTLLAIWNAKPHCQKLQFANKFKCSQRQLLKLLTTSGTRSNDPYNPIALEQLISLLYQFFDSEEMDEVMYTEELGHAIQFQIICYLIRYSDVSDKIIAELLRLALYNCTHLDYDLHNVMVCSVVNPIETIKVLEDFNVVLIGDPYRITMSIFEPILDDAPANLETNYSWRMYLESSRNIGKATCDKKTRKFFIDTRCNIPASLLEQCRNRIRDAYRYNIFNSKQLYSYATKIKSLPCPQVVHDILLLRKPIY